MRYTDLSKTKKRKVYALRRFWITQWSSEDKPQTPGHRSLMPSAPPHVSCILDIAQKMDVTKTIEKLMITRQAGIVIMPGVEKSSI